MPVRPVPVAEVVSAGSTAAARGEGYRSRIAVGDLEGSRFPEVWEDAHLPDGSEVRGADLRHGRFVRFGAKACRFERCDFSYAVFEGAYFHQAEFVECRFVGATFTASVLRNATFEGCDFRYARLSATIVPPAGVLRQLPPEPNLKQDLCQELRRNFESLGDGRAARDCFMKEMEAEADHLRRAWKADETYYRRKYGGRLGERTKMFGRYVANRIGRRLWGHGERPDFVLGWSLAALTALSVWAVIQGYAASGWEAVYLVGMTFASQSPPGPVEPVPRAFLLTTALTGYAALGLFVASLFRRLARR